MFYLSNVYVIGDIHGSFKPIRNFYNKNKDKIDFDREKTVLILLGDAGLNYFKNERDAQLKRELSRFPFTYFIIRGNHEERPSNMMKENPDKWNVETFFHGKVYVEKEYPYIKYAKDTAGLYHILKNDKETIRVLTLPGAYSVDKEYRQLMGYAWFPDEQMSPYEQEYAKTLVGFAEHCDVVLSHTCPCCYEPTDLFLSFVDQSKVDKSMEWLLGGIEFVLDYKLWMWGHYHKYRDYPRADGRKKLMLFHEVVNLEQVLNEDVPEVLCTNDPWG